MMLEELTEEEMRDYIRLLKKDRRDYIRRLVIQEVKDAQQFVVRWGNLHGPGYKTDAEAVVIATGLERAVKMLENMEEV